MLNFLYKVPFITRVFTTNVTVGCKYASYERCLQLIAIEHVMLKPSLFIPNFTIF